MMAHFLDMERDCDFVDGILEHGIFSWIFIEMMTGFHHDPLLLLSTILSTNYL